MRAPRALVFFALVLFLIAASSQWTGCGGGNGGGSQVTFSGEVAGVTRSGDEGGDEGGEAKASGGTTLLARVFSFFLGTATAQNDCQAEKVLACARTRPAAPDDGSGDDGSGEGGEESGEPAESSKTCQAIDVSTCTFETGIRLAKVGDPLELYFCDDVNGTGVCSEEEPKAALARDFGEICNGDTVDLSGVQIDFANGVATANVMEVSEPSACPPPPTPTPLPACPVAGDLCDYGDPMNPCAPEHCGDNAGLICRSDGGGTCGQPSGPGEECGDPADCQNRLLCLGGYCTP